MKMHAGIVAAAIGATLPFLLHRTARAADVSPPVILQWFESSWKTMEKRVPDHFSAGYGAIWTPPPGRALYDDQGGGIGYNLYDRFDLGKPGDTTLYGTEKGYRSLIKNVQRSNGDVYVDYVHHHVGSWDVPGYNGWGGWTPAPGAQIQDRSDYPGFELSDPYVGANSFNPNYRNLPGHRDSYPDAPPVNDGNTPQYQYQYRLAHLVTIDLTSNRTNVRNPVPGEANNVRQAANGWAIGTSTMLPNGKPGAASIVRRANTPDENNRRFYPDQSLPGITVTDPATGGGTYTIHPFNTANPTAGDPTSETNVGYMMRYAQWLVNDIGVDGLRIDAARHVPYGQSGDPYNPNNLNVPALVDRATFRQSTRTNLDGSQRTVFNFQEVFTGDQNLLQTFTRKDINPNTPNVVGGNRDVLDFPMWFAMRQNLTGNGLNNNWHRIRNASFDLHDDGLNNGSQGIGFVINHDDGKGPGGSDFIALDNVAHAWILTRPGNAMVYFNSHEFDRTGNNEFFLKDGRGDALGGQYGNIVTKLVDIRNSYGRGDYQERWIDDAFNPNGFSNIYVFERKGSMIVGLNSALGQTTNYDQRGPMNSSFPAGTRLEEQTGNSLNPEVDPLGEIPDVITVGAGGTLTMRIPRNQTTGSGTPHGKGYVIYGLPRPQGDLSLSNVAQTLGPESGSNASARLTAIDVITANSFNINLNTNKRTLSDGFHDVHADGDRAYVRIDGGLDLNNSGTVDFRDGGAGGGDTRYGFENFTTVNPGYNNQPAGTGTYSIGVNAANLSEGYHYVTARAFRHMSFAGEQEVFTDFKKVIYVDRLKPVSALDNAVVLGGNDREIRTKSVDQTADTVFTFMNLPANLTEAQVIALATGGSQATQIDRDLFAKTFTNVVNGNNAVTVVTREITGNTNVQRFAGVNLLTTNGAGLGDLNQNNQYEPGDVTGTAYGMEAIVYPNGGGTTNFAFNAAADVNADGLIDSRDLYGVELRYEAVSAPEAVKDAARESVLRRGDMNQLDGTNASDIDFLYANFGNTAWRFDLDVDGWPTPSGADQQDVDVLVRTIFRTEYGDADLNGSIDFDDYVLTDGGYNGGLGGWANGDFDGNGSVDFDDYVILDLGFNSQGSLVRAQRYLSGDDRSENGMDDPGLQLVKRHFEQFGVPYARALIAAVPEPGLVWAIGMLSLVALRRKRQGL